MPQTATNPASAAPIIDADGHIVEPEATWAEHLHARFLSFVPRPVQHGEEFWFRCGETESFRVRARPESLAAPRRAGERSGGGEPVSGATDPAARLRDMAVDGIRRSVIYPTYGLMVQGVRDAEAAPALCRAINDWMADYCRHDPARLFAVGVLPQTSPGAALEEARHCVEGLGMRGVLYANAQRFYAL